MKIVLFLANRDFVLYNFRFELIESLLKQNYQVYICLPYGPKIDIMVSAGCKYVPIEIESRGTNPLKDLKVLFSYREIFKKVQPDIILLYTTKVCIYGGLLASHMGIPYLENISGLGTAVEYDNRLQRLMVILYRGAVKHANQVFFQNEENKDFFKRKKIYVLKSKLIPGSGVNLERWKPMKYPSEEDEINFLFIARIIKEKGIEEYLAAAKAIKSTYKNAMFHILGPCDGNYKDILKQYQDQGIIIYHGMVQDTRPYIEKVHCTIHPSYYPEGISNVLLESAACCRPVITTDRSGCRETVDDGITGFIFPQRDTQALIKKIEEFIKLDWADKKRMGELGRLKMEREFDRKIVTKAYLDEIGSIL